MNYYAFHLGDYASATAHLSWDEDMAYRRLIDAYYQKESPLPEDIRQIYRLARAQTECQRLAIDTVLSEFFSLTDEGWRHFRCDAEIEAISIKRDKASKSALARWSKANAMPTQSERNANASEDGCERIENGCDGNAPNPNPNPNPNQTAKSIRTQEKIGGQKSLSAKYLVSLGVDQQHAKDWLAARKLKRLALTQTALDGVIREAAKGGKTLAQAIEIAARNSWAGYKASWKEDQHHGQNPGAGSRNLSLVDQVREHNRLAEEARQAEAAREDAGFLTLDGEIVGADD